MRYVKTSTGIFKEFKSNGKMIYKDAIGNVVGILLEDIKASSEELHVLCDTFVIESNEEGNTFMTTCSDIWAMKRSNYWLHWKAHYNFFGAIHVKEIGTIYAAKLHEDGRMRLFPRKKT